MDSKTNDRRGFLHGMLAAGSLAAAVPAAAQAQPASSAAGELPFLPAYTRAHNYKSLKQSSFDRTGGNSDRWPIAAGGVQEVFNATGAGVITHIWFTIAARSNDHLKELVLRAYWDGNAKPSVEVPVGDFFGLNLGIYQIYESEYLACSPGRSLNCYFAMPYKRSARFTVTNEGSQEIDSFYSNIDYMAVPTLPDDSLYFHAQYRQSDAVRPGGGERAEDQSGRQAELRLLRDARARPPDGGDAGRTAERQRLVGRRRRDDLRRRRDEAGDHRHGQRGLFPGELELRRADGAAQFAHRQYGAPLIVNPRTDRGRYCCYRWHGDNPVTFEDT